ncbi:MAG: AMP-binding protein, partial [Rhodobacteraceae bacterium]|nr:AMP-binding protein [Paracoccaceae bacterium]
MNSISKSNWTAFDDLPIGEANHAALSPVPFLSRAARVFPDKIAVIDGQRSLTYRRLRERCRQCADALRRAGIRSGDVVSVMAPNTSAMLELHFAVPLSGAVLNAINTRLDPTTVLVILRHAGTRVLFIDTAFAEVIAAVRDTEELRVHIVEITAQSDCEYDAFVDTGRTDASLPEISDENAPISLNYTSGTTGNPKGVV